MLFLYINYTVQISISCKSREILIMASIVSEQSKLPYHYSENACNYTFLQAHCTNRPVFYGQRANALYNSNHSNHTHNLGGQALEPSSAPMLHLTFGSVIESLETCVLYQDVSRHIFTYLSGLSIDRCMSCLGSSLNPKTTTTVTVTR